MEITLQKGNTFRIKGKTGVLYTKDNGFLIESPDGSSTKELFGPGEYEVSGISVIGVQTEDGVCFVYEVDGIRVCDFSGNTQKLTDARLSSVGEVDVLLLPVVERSVEIMQSLESYYVLPFSYKEIADLEKFLKDSGLVVVNMPKFSLKKEEIIEDSPTQIVVLESK